MWDWRKNISFIFSYSKQNTFLLLLYPSFKISSVLWTKMIPFKCSGNTLKISGSENLHYWYKYICQWRLNWPYRRTQLLFNTTACDALIDFDTDTAIDWEQRNYPVIFQLMVSVVQDISPRFDRLLKFWNVYGRKCGVKYWFTILLQLNHTFYCCYQIWIFIFLVCVINSYLLLTNFN